MLNLRMLQYLVALADTRHFGRAADRCFVSQPTLSAQLKKLEEQLGVQLVERQRKQLLLTDVGEEIVARARQIIDECDQIVELARQVQDPTVGRLRLGMIPTIGPYLLPAIIRGLTEAFPGLKLLLYEYRTAELIDKVRGGELDLAILALPGDTQGLEVRFLFAEPFLVAMPGKHELAKKSSINVKDLEGETLLLLEDGHCLRDQALEVCSRIDYRESQDLRATSLETLRHMVYAGAGITLLPRMAIGEQRPAITVRPFARPAPERRIGAIWRTSSAMQITINRLCDEIVRMISEKRRAKGDN